MDFLDRVKKNTILRDYTTYKIGGPAKYFFVAQTEQDVIDALEFARKEKLEVLILGGGSNLLVSDEGFNGLVIKIEIKGISLVGENIVEAGSGVTMQELVDFSIENSLEGLEWAGGLPGTFGGAIRGNAGAFGGEIKDSIDSVKMFHNGELASLSNKDCNFLYRSSIFKERGGVIISATVKLKKGDKQKLKAIADSRIAYRKEKHPLEYPNAGSVFKGVAFDAISENQKTIFSDKVKIDPFPIIPAAWFIIEAGLAGKVSGQAQFSEKHSNYIVNLGAAKSQDVVNSIKLAQHTVKEKFGVNLEPEIQFLEN